MIRRRNRNRSAGQVYRFAIHARVTSPMRPSRHGSVVKRGLGHTGPLYGVLWDDGKHSLENAHGLRLAHGGAAHKNHSIVGKRAWRHRNRASGGVTRERAEAIAKRVTIHKSGRGDSWFVLGNEAGGAFVIQDVPLYALREGDVVAHRLGRTEGEGRGRLVDKLVMGTIAVDAGSRLNRALGVVGTATGSNGQRFRVSGRLELKKRRAKKIVESSEMPGEAFFETPENVEAPQPKAKAPRPSVRKGPRYEKEAYRAAAEARGNIPPDQLIAFEGVWKSLWPTGRATLTERFAEWVEEHPGELAEFQMQSSAKAEKAMWREDALRIKLEKLERARERASYSRPRAG